MIFSELPVCMFCFSELKCYITNYRKEIWWDLIFIFFLLNRGLFSAQINFDS